MADPQYTTPTLLKARLGPPDPGGAFDSLIDEALGWATAEIDSYTHRTFLASTQTRTYSRDWVNPDEPRTLSLDEDLLSVTTLLNADGTLIDPSQYWLSPPNEVPHYEIQLKTPAYFVWPVDGLISVAGSWGYSATPSPLVAGTCLRLAEWYYKSNKMSESVNPFSGSISSKPGPGYPADILTTLDRLVKLAR